jgi:hypothetical protein
LRERSRVSNRVRISEGEGDLGKRLKGYQRKIDIEGWWVGGRGGDIMGTQGGREKEEKRWGMGRVG